MLVRLWRELHPKAPMHQLTFRSVEKKDNPNGVVEEVSGKVLPLLALPNAQAPELIGALARSSPGLRK